MSIYHQMHRINKQKPYLHSSSFLGHYLTVVRAPLYVWRYTNLSNPFCLLSTAAQSNTSVCIDAALLLCQHVCVKGPGRTDATGLWKSKPISVSKSWGMALRIQTCFNQADTLWQWWDLVHEEGRGWTHCDGSWQPHVALTDCVRVCTCILRLVMPCLVGNSANVAVFWPSGWPGMAHVDIPSLSNK